MIKVYCYLCSYVLDTLQGTKGRDTTENAFSFTWPFTRTFHVEEIDMLVLSERLRITLRWKP